MFSNLTPQPATCPALAEKAIGSIYPGCVLEAEVRAGQPLTVARPFPVSLDPGELTELS
jgi:hypothetical protein